MKDYGRKDQRRDQKNDYINKEKNQYDTIGERIAHAKEISS